MKAKFLRNGYPNRFIESTIRLYHRRKTNPSNAPLVENRTFIKCLFVNEKSKRLYVSFLRKLGLHEIVNPWFHGGRSLKRIFHPPKEKLSCDVNCKFCAMGDKRNMCCTKFVIYQINCAYCDEIYVGQTKRLVKSRLNEHLFLNSPESAVREHFTLKHPGFEPSIKWKLLHSGVSNYQKRLVLEALYISNVDPTKLMNNCKGINLNIL